MKTSLIFLIIASSITACKSKTEDEILPRNRVVDRRMFEAYRRGCQAALWYKSKPMEAGLSYKDILYCDAKAVEYVSTH